MLMRTPMMTRAMNRTRMFIESGRPCGSGGGYSAQMRCNDTEKAASRDLVAGVLDCGLRRNDGGRGDS